MSKHHSSHHGVTFLWLIATVLALATLSSGGCGKKGPTAPTGPEVKISIQALYMNVRTSQTITASGGDEIKYSWSISGEAGGTIVPNADTKSAVLTAGANPGSYVVTVRSGGQSSFMSVYVLTRIGPEDDFKYVRPAGSITNPAAAGSPASGLLIFFNYTAQNSTVTNCLRGVWNGVDTMTCPELAGVPKGNHIVYALDFARTAFGNNGFPVNGSNLVGNNFFLNGQLLPWDAGCPASFPVAARCAHFSK